MKIPCNLRHANTVTFFLSCLWTGAVIMASLVPVNLSQDPMRWAHVDKLVHFIFYFVAILLWQGAGYRSHRPLIALFILGWAIEWAQHLSGWRSGELFDGLLNTLGLLAGWAVFWMLNWLRSS